MATPIETNTEELQGILQQVYNLPNRSAGGSAEPDLVLLGGDDYDTASPSIEDISFDQAQVVATYQKVLAGEDASVIIKGKAHMDSIYPPWAFTQKAVLVSASDEGKLLQCQFLFPGSVSGGKIWVFGSRIIFSVNPANNTASIDNIHYGQNAG